MTDLYGRTDLAALGLTDWQIDWLLRQALVTGHDRQPVVEADRLGELLEALPSGEEVGGE